MTQTIEYVVKVNATQAQAAVADVEKRFGGVDTVVARVDKSIIALERDMKDLNAAIAAGGPNVGHYQQELERLAGTVGMGGGGGKTGGGKSLGMAALEGSRAVEDLQYGLAGVVNNIPSLVMALGGGAGLTAAISLAAVGVNQLYKNFLAVPDATETATTTAKSYIKDLRDEIAELGKDLRTVQIGATGVAMEEQRKRIQIAMVEARSVIDAVGGQEALADLRQLTKDRPEMLPSRGWGPLASRNYVSPEAFQAAIDAQTKLDLEIKKMQRLQLIELEKEEKKGAEERGKTSGRAFIEAKQKEERDYAVPFEEQAAYGTGFRGQTLRSTILEDTAKRQAEAAQDASDLENEIRQEMLKHDEKNNAAAEKLDRERTRELDRQARERQQIREREAEHARRLHEQEVEYLTQMGTTAAAAIGTFAAQSAAGQEAAFQTLLQTASMQAGGIIMLEGGKVMAAGISGMLTAPNPISAAQIVGGGALVAAGAAVQTGGPAVISSLMSMATGGGGKQAAAKDRGASPRSGSGGGGGSGGLVVNVSYGAGGPLPEDIAREIDKVVKSNDRRRGAA